MKCTTTATLQLLFFLTSSGSWNTQKAISSLEPSSDVDTVTAMEKSETSVGRRSSDEDDDEDDASCEWFSGFSVGERDRRSTFADRSRRSCMCQYCGGSASAHMCALCAHNLRRLAHARSAIPRQNIPLALSARCRDVILCVLPEGSFLQSVRDLPLPENNKWFKIIG